MSGNVQTVNIPYHSVCWQCRSEISSDFCVRCPICGWYYCRNCGACRMGGGCVGSYCKTPEEFTAARAEFIRAHRYDGASPKEWLASYVAEKEREQAKQNSLKMRIVQKEFQIYVMLPQLARQFILQSMVSVLSPVLDYRLTVNSSTSVFLHLMA